MSKPNRIRNHVAAALVTASATLTLAGAAEAVDLRDWGRKLPASERFVVLSQFSSEAVLDKETQLLWERTPNAGLLPWSSAFASCLQRTIGGRKGWRLPAAEELSSLFDASALPSGHPFLGVQYEAFWSATSHPSIDGAFAMFGTGGSVFHLKSTSHRTWCVRGSQGHDGQ